MVDHHACFDEVCLMLDRSLAMYRSITCGYISRNNIFAFVVKSLRNVIELTVQIYCKQQTSDVEISRIFS
jgi:hypothetical protein